jgi:hypothetical protein
MSEATISGLHAGRTGDADALFLKKNLIAVGWSALGDLSKIEPSREAFKAAVAKTWPDKKPGRSRTMQGSSSDSCTRWSRATSSSTRPRPIARSTSVASKVRTVTTRSSRAGIRTFVR